MKRHSFIIFAILAILLPLSCSKKNASSPQVSGKILVLHSLDSTYYAKCGYDEILRESFASNGINPEIQNIYLCGADDEFYHASHVQLARLLFSGWVPDVICINEDKLLDDVVCGRLDEWFEFTQRSLPIVAAGIHCPDWTSILSYGNAAICTDLVDFENNLTLAKYMSGKSVITIELDYDDYDNRLRTRLSQETNRPPFVNNSDFRVNNTSLPELEEAYKDSIFINVFSGVHPERNRFHRNTELFNKLMIKNLATSTVLTVKMDPASEEIINHCQTPQYTSIREGFADGSGRYLCGYFASYSTVAEDQGAYVARILSGAKTGQLPIISHKKEYFADWKAMELAGYQFSDLALAAGNEAGVPFNVIGASQYERHPFLFFIIPILILLCLVTFSWYFTSLLYKRPFARMDKEIEELENEFKLYSLALRNSNCIFINNRQDIFGIQDQMHPDETITLNKILYGKKTDSGENQVIRLSNDNGATWRRWQFRPGHNNQGDNFTGVFLDVEDTLTFKDEMTKTAEMAEQIRMKEDFVKNITHEVRTPLNAIVGFSQVLGLDDGSLSGDEREEISRYIRDNNKDLSRIIQVILRFSRLESGRIVMNPADTEIAPLMIDIYNAWKENAGEGLEFILDKGHPGVVAYVDKHTISDIMDEYLNNAFKFTEKGYVKMGWDYNLESGTVTIFVEDSGRGLKQDKKEYIYKMFWKDDMFKNGVGLGLTLAKTYTENMGGTLMLQTQENVGSRFGSVFAAKVNGL